MYQGEREASLMDWKKYPTIDVLTTNKSLYIMKKDEGESP